MIGHDLPLLAVFLLRPVLLIEPTSDVVKFSPNPFLKLLYQSLERLMSLGEVVSGTAYAAHSSPTVGRTRDPGKRFAARRGLEQK